MANEAKASLIITAIDKASETIRGVTGNLDKVQAAFGRLGGALAIGGSVTWLTNLATQSLQAIDRLDDLSKGLGIAAEKLSAYELTAKAAGVDQEQLAQGLNKLNNLLSAAAGGSLEAQAVFRSMGVEFKTASGSARSMEDVLGDVADRMRQYADGAQKSALANELFGRSGARFVAFLSEGREGLDAFGGATKEQIENARQLNANLDRLSAGWEKLKLAVGGGIGSIFKGSDYGEETSSEALDRVNGQIAKLNEELARTKNEDLAGNLIIALEGLNDQAARLAKTLEAQSIQRFLSGAHALRAAETGSSDAPNVDEIRARMRAQEEARKAAERIAEQRRKATQDALSEVTALELTNAGTVKLTAAQQLMLRIGEQLRNQQLVWNETLTRGTFARLAAADAQERLNAEQQQEFERRAKAGAEYVRQHESAQALVEDLEAEAAALRLTSAEREVAIELRKLEKTGVDQASEAYRQYREQIERAVFERSAAKAAAEAAEESQRAWTRAADQIESALTDAMVSGFEGGKSIAKSVGDWIANYFRTVVARTIAQAMMAAIAAGLSGAASASGGGGGFNLGTVASVGSSLFGGGGGSLGSLGSIGAIGGVGTFAATGLMNTLAAWGIGTGTAGATVGAGFSAAGSLMGGGNVLGGAAMGLGTVMPYLAIAYGLYRLISGVGTGRMRGPAWQQWASQTAGGGAWDPYAGVTSNPALGGAGYFNQQIRDIVRSIDTIAAKFGGKVNPATAFGLYVSQGTEGSGALADARVRGSLGANLFGFSSQGGNADVYQRLMSAVPGMILAGLQDSDLPEQIKRFFTSVSAYGVTQEQLDTMLRIADAAHQMAESFKLLGGPFLQLADVSVEARMALADLTGGIDAFGQKVAGYYSQFYSNEEQQALSLVQAQKILQQAGIDTGALFGKSDYRSMVDAIDVSTDSGRQRFAALMNAAGAFSSGSELLALSGMSLGQFTAGYPELSDNIETMGATQNETNSILTSIESTISAGLKAVVDAIKGQAIEVTMPTQGWEVGYNTGGGN